MSTAIASPKEHDEGEHAHEVPYKQQLRANRLGIWLFCFSELFLFGALLVMRFVLWGNTRPDLSQEIGLVTTTVLLFSSYFMYRAETGAMFGDKKRMMNGLVIAFLLGVLFLIGVIVFEWNIFGLEGSLFGIEIFGHLQPTDGVYGGVFFAMTGMHSIHVISGLILIAIIWFHGRHDAYTPERHWGVEGTAIYWHYVDVVWIVFYPALYLIGKAV